MIPDSDAHQAELQEGDQVLAVNYVVFQDTEHSTANEILKTACGISVSVCFFPYNYHCQRERTVHYRVAVHSPPHGILDKLARPQESHSGSSSLGPILKEWSEENGDTVRPCMESAS